MARPIKEGMDYFPHDVDAMSDDKIEILRTLYGNNGYVFYFGLLERIYRQPDFEYDISDAETIQILSKKFLISVEEFNLMLQTALKYHCFDSEYYEQTGYLTSNGIKKRGDVVVKKREVRRNRYTNGVCDVVCDDKTMSQTTQSKVKESKVKKYTPPISPPEVGKGTDDDANLFEKFWAVYPRKVSKKYAAKIWKKINPDAELTNKIILSVEEHKITSQWTKDNGEFIPHPSTFLNQEKWNDELIPKRTYEGGDDW